MTNVVVRKWKNSTQVGTTQGLKLCAPANSQMFHIYHCAISQDAVCLPG